MSRKTGSLADEVARLLARCTRDGDCLMVPVKGYGEVRYEGGRRMHAHRAVFVTKNGPLAPGQVVRHTCDRIGCVEASHLLSGTPLDNARDMAERERGLIGLRHHFVTVSPEEIRAAVTEYLQGGKSQAEMAQRLGIGATTFGRWVRAEARRDAGLDGVSVGRGSRIATGLKPCGTRAGIYQHKQRGEVPCEACREADRAYMRAWKAKRRKVKPQRVWSAAASCEEAAT